MWERVIKIPNLSFQDKLLHPAMYDVPGSDILCVMINEDCVLNKVPAVYRRESQDSQNLKTAKLNNW